MSLVADTILPPRRERSWTLWTAAAAVIVAAHAILGLYVLFVRDEDDYGAKTPDAIIIDLTPIAAPPVEEKAPPPVVEKTQPPEPEPKTAEPEPKVIPVPDAVPEPQPLAQMPLLQTPPLPLDVPAEVTLPAPVPEPQPLNQLPQLPKTHVLPDLKAKATLREPEPKETVRKGVPKAEPRSRQESRPTQRPENSDRAQQRLAARSEAQPAPATSAASLASWKGELVAHIRRFQRYPEAARSRNETGTASVSFTLDRSGRVVSARLASSSGSSTLDQEAVATVQRASPMPAPPNGSSVTINVPLRYSLR